MSARPTFIDSLGVYNSAIAADNQGIKRVHGWLNSATVELPKNPHIIIQKYVVASTEMELACQSEVLYTDTASDQGLKMV